MPIQEVLSNYFSYLSKIWQEIFKKHNIHGENNEEYVQYISKKLQQRIILSTPLVTILIISKAIIYYNLLNFKSWLSVTLVHFILSDISLIAIAYKSLTIKIPDKTYYKNIFFLSSYTLFSCIGIYIYCILYNIPCLHEVLIIGVLLFLWLFNYSSKWTFLIPFIIIIFYFGINLALYNLTPQTLTNTLMILIFFTIGAFYSLINGANEYNLFLSFKDAQIQALTDNLTKIFNRRGFINQFQFSRKVAIREKKSNYLAIIDIDSFKKINDIHGHDIGDKVIISVAKQLTLLYRRPLDIVARWGGEEFIIFWCEDNSNHPILMGQKTCLEIANLKIALLNQELSFTISIGITQILDSDLLDDAVKRADLALYKAKNNGKNQAILN